MNWLQWQNNYDKSYIWYMKSNYLENGTNRVNAVLLYKFWNQPIDQPNQPNTNYYMNK